VKISVDRVKFLKAIDIVSPLCGRHSKSELHYVCLDAVRDEVKLQATDGEQSVVVASKDHEILSPGSVLINPQKVIAMLRESKEEYATIYTDGSAVKVESKYSKFSIPSSNPDAFPRCKAKVTEAVDFEAKQFCDALRRCAHACDTESTRYQLGGVYVEFGGREVSFVATDGRRLSTSSISVPDEVNQSSCIVPAKSVGAIIRAFGESKRCSVQIVINDLIVENDQMTFQTRLIEGRYPNWRMVLPEASGSPVVLNAGQVYSAVRQAAITATADNSGIELIFTDGNLSITSKTAEVGAAKVDLPVAFDGKLNLVMDYRFLQDFLKGCEPEAMFELYAKSATEPALFVDGSCRYVIMPMSRT